MNALNHWAQRYECETCDREFLTQESANQHMNALDHWELGFECETCTRSFSTQESANQHMNDTGHWEPEFECETCTRSFNTQESANQHMNDTGHWEPEFECETCSRSFRTQKSVDQHMEALDHYKRHYCNDCNKAFQDGNSLKMHLNSSIHRGKNITCPFCKVDMTSASGLSHHLESGSCPRATNINHGTIFRAISQRDPSGTFTKNLLTYPDFNVENIATSASWNGWSYECYLCHQLHDTLRALNQHLSSLAHSEKWYHCPNRSCERNFVSLAALFNHFESESCNYVRFEKVQENVGGFISGRRLVGFV
ncbi:zinc finger protein [Phaeosphaeriaceae sp. PMI808]|nr:zinc finger protein [Phaeosphaeriaceae sp. PMI808]